MAAEHGPGRPDAVTTGSVTARLALAVLLAAIVTGVLVIAGRAHQPDYAASHLRADRDRRAGAQVLAGQHHSVLAAGQVLLALWLYRKLPGLPAPGRWVARAHRLTRRHPDRRHPPGRRALPDRLRDRADQPPAP